MREGRKKRLLFYVFLLAVTNSTPSNAKGFDLPAMVQDVIPEGCTHYAHNPSGRLAYRMGRLPENKGRIWIIPCTVRLSETTQVVIRVMPSSPVELLTFRQWDHGVWKTSSYLFNVTYDDQTGVLTSLHRDDSLGDCGTWTVWQASGADFIMQRLDVKTECDGREGPYRTLYLYLGNRPS